MVKKNEVDAPLPTKKQAKKAAKQEKKRTQVIAKAVKKLNAIQVALNDIRDLITDAIGTK